MREDFFQSPTRTDLKTLTYGCCHNVVFEEDEHPDPDGRQLSILASAAQSYLQPNGALVLCGELLAATPAFRPLHDDANF